MATTKKTPAAKKKAAATAPAKKRALEAVMKPTGTSIFVLNPAKTSRTTGTAIPANWKIKRVTVEPADAGKFVVRVHDK